MSSSPWWWSPWPTRPEHDELAARVAAAEERITVVEAVNQSHIDALSQRLDAVAGGLRADIDTLKAQVESGETLDFTALDNRLGLLEALDAQNPESTPVVPPNEPAPEPAPTPEPAPGEPTPGEPAPGEPTPGEPAPQQ